jgi:hypothetical protein
MALQLPLMVEELMKIFIFLPAGKPLIDVERSNLNGSYELETDVRVNEC